MKRFLAIVAIAAVSLSTATFATGVDPSDSVLVAYKLTSAQSAQFNPSDTTVSPFWDLIAEKDHDYWKLLPSTSNYQQGGTGFANDSDAQVTMKAAYDSNGVYFYFKVLDNTWDPNSLDPNTGWQSDVVDLYIDNQSSDSINAADPSTEFTNGHFTSTSEQYWIPVGGDGAPAQIGLNYWDVDQSSFTNTTPDTAGASQKIKLVKLDSMTRVLEMFIPWKSVGLNGVTDPGPVGTHYAIAGGYNDADGGTFIGCLRAFNNGDPYQTDKNYWANLELGSLISDQPTGVKKVPGLHCSKVALQKIIKSEYFNLAGRKIENLHNINKYHYLIRQDLLENGKIQRSVIRN